MADLVLSVNPALVEPLRSVINNCETVISGDCPDRIYTPTRRKHLLEEIGLAQPETAVAIVTKCPAPSANE